MRETITKKVFDDYFDNFPKEKERKIRPQVDRREVYEYELKLGKTIFDMNCDELFSMIMSFGNNRARTPESFTVSPATFTQMCSIYRSIWNYYIDNYEIIKNPWNDKSLKGLEAEKRLFKVKGTVSFSDINKAVNSLKKSYNPDMMNYIECMILLFYNGIPSSKDIVLIKEKNINYRTKEVELSDGRIKKLSDRCFELFNRVHTMDSSNSKYVLLPYQDSYFRFYILKSNADTFQDRSIEMVSRIISKKIDTELRTNCGLDIGCRSIYLLGFYDNLVSSMGKEEAKRIIYAYRDSESTRKLEKYAAIYGVNVPNITSLRRSLKQFVEQ